MGEFEDDSRKLVPAQGDMQGFDKKHQEKWLIYCPSIASDTLLYMITALESYSLRTYGGRLGVNTTGMHAEGAHSTGEFMSVYAPKRWKEASHMEIPVTNSERWAKVVEQQWASFQKAELGKQ